MERMLKVVYKSVHDDGNLLKETKKSCMIDRLFVKNIECIVQDHKVMFIKKIQPISSCLKTPVEIHTGLNLLKLGLFKYSD